MVDEDHDAGGGQHPERQIYKEYPAPVVILGQPAAERRADDRAEDDSHPPHRHGLGVTLRRVDLQQHRLRQRHQRRPACALDQPVDHQLGEARRQTAQGRGHGEADNRDQKHVLDAKAAGEPAGQRRHDRRGDDVRGHHPGDLVLGHRKAALHVRQRHIGDRGVDPLHEGRHHDRHGDPAPVRHRGRGGVAHRAASCGALPPSPANSPSMRSSHGRRYWVSTSTVALNPEASGCFGSS